jgi:hypothetical protein
MAIHESIISRKQVHLWFRFTEKLRTDEKGIFVGEYFHARRLVCGPAEIRQAGRRKSAP